MDISECFKALVKLFSGLFFARFDLSRTIGSCGRLPKPDMEGIKARKGFMAFQCQRQPSYSLSMCVT
ncbi:hypothetical protein XENTR_v10007093 [Xenopus tropicalis]|nr:hypothetical protein XENTR_v10007093 [Xenopus tropicalis]